MNRRDFLGGVADHRQSLMAEGQKFTHGDVVRLLVDLWPYKAGELLTVVESSLQQQGKVQRNLDEPNRNSFLNSYSCNGVHGHVAWLSLDEIEGIE